MAYKSLRMFEVFKLRITRKIITNHFLKSHVNLLRNFLIFRVGFSL